MASSALIACSATRLLGRYRDWYMSQHYNSIRIHLRHLTTAAHAVLFGYRQYELSKTEAESSLCTAVTLIGLLVPRWTRTAVEAIDKILTVSAAFGASLYVLSRSYNRLDGARRSVPTRSADNGRVFQLYILMLMP